jgi:formylglycine-generating enzyme required for sulfatase activity
MRARAVRGAALTILLAGLAAIPALALAQPTVPDVTRPTVPPRTERPAEPKTITNAIGMKLVLIPAGEFLMGSADSDKNALADEKPQHGVRITQSFYLAATEVTQGEYEMVMGRNPSKFSAQGDYRKAVAGEDTLRHPVENVSWNEAREFCNKLSAREGLKPYYPFGGGAP